MGELHEHPGELSAEARDLHRTLQSLKEEIEAVDWYHQRSQLACDPELADILRHNRDEEIEHACIILEWLRRSMPGWDEQMKAYLFTEGPILERERALVRDAEDTRAGPRPSSEMRSLGLRVGHPEER